MNVELLLDDVQLAELAALVAPLVRGGKPVEERSPWRSIADAAEYLSVGERTIERAISAGSLKSSTVGRRRIIHVDDLDSYARKCQTT